MVDVPKKKYGIGIVAQSNKLIEAFHGMSLTEKRLLMHASIIASQQEIKEGDVLTIRAVEFAAEAGIKPDIAYIGLQDVVEHLFKRYFVYTSATGDPVKVRWVTRVEYKKKYGEIDIYFPAEVISMITLFNKDNPFTTYESKIVQQMTSIYAVRFFELFMQYRAFGQRLFEITQIKNMFELNDKYDRIANLKLRVIDPAIEQINHFTDYTVTYEKIKKGRTVTSILFTFFPKSNVVAIPEKESDQPQIEQKVQDGNLTQADTNLIQADTNQKPIVETQSFFSSQPKPPPNVKHQEHVWSMGDKALFKGFVLKCPNLTTSHIQRISAHFGKPIDLVLATMHIKFAKVESFKIANLANLDFTDSKNK